MLYVYYIIVNIINNQLQHPIKQNIVKHYCINLVQLLELTEKGFPVKRFL